MFPNTKIQTWINFSLNIRCDGVQNLKTFIAHLESRKTWHDHTQSSTYWNEFSALLVQVIITTIITITSIIIIIITYMIQYLLFRYTILLITVWAKIGLGVQWVISNISRIANNNIMVLLPVVCHIADAPNQNMDYVYNDTRSFYQSIKYTFYAYWCWDIIVYRLDLHNGPMAKSRLVVGN